MTTLCKQISCALVLIAMALIASRAAVRAEQPESATEDRQPFADAKLFSVIPGHELATYEAYGLGGVGPNGTGESGVGKHGRQFQVSITGKRMADRFSVVVRVVPEKADARTRPLEKEYDLSDYLPQSVELARDADGRVYRLTICPRIEQSPLPTQFEVKDLDLQAFSFPSSPVVINDIDYAGELSASRGPIVQFDVPGLAKLEFSLLHLKHAAPIGSLRDGQINISRPDGTTVRISNVKNGVNEEVLRGGPYTIWVKWDKPSESIEQFQKSFKEMIVGAKEEAKTGELWLPPERLQRLEKISQSGRPYIMTFEVRGVEPGDLDESAKSQHHSGGKNQ